MPAIEGFVNYDPEKDLPSFKGKVIFVTGGTAGLGRESIEALAKHDPEHIYFSGRNAKAATTLIETINEANPGVGLTFVDLDMTSLASVRAAMRRFTHHRLDVLMCNAGIMAHPPAVTKDGFELQFGVNHLAHAVIIDSLLPTLQKTADLVDSDVRVICLTLEGYKGHPMGGFLYDRLRTPMDMFFGSWLRYGQSKLANVAYAKEVARRYPKIMSVSVHPGVVKTELVTNLTFVRRAFVYISNFLMGTPLMEPKQGSYSQLWVTGADREQLVSGAYYKPIGVEAAVDATVNSEEVAMKLWNWTQDTLKRFEQNLA
ncbi:hypothetical protein B0J13DRAFT_486311 [Dactylonectria estremocensis]|uniref:Oxidoreductase n=1 Tax=Dactylonectria estremocensis TaxID=1079267 RepID=A0A9P9DJ60_9HYPO|nr:hypothetical protein B0J13DRAFT_486311 [Dactylonectria estremocensis]